MLSKNVCIATQQSSLSEYFLTISDPKEESSAGGSSQNGATSSGDQESIRSMDQFNVKFRDITFDAGNSGKDKKNKNKNKGGSAPGVSSNK